MRRRAAAAACAIFALAAAPALSQLPFPRPARGVGSLAGDLAQDFRCEVDMRLDVPADEQALYSGMLQQALSEAGLDLAPQHVLVVDRNAHVQAAFLFRLTPGGDWLLTGAVPVSTGLPGEFEHFATPLGLFPHGLDNPDFRAEGTLNENNIRGYGRKGMRVFDFGWVDAPKGWGDHAMSHMRLQLHATDPDQLERWLGRPRSKGCIRVPASFDDFLDRRAVLDAEYEDSLADGHKLWVVLADREATRWPGRYLVIVDSERGTRPSWSPAPTGKAWRSPRPQDCPAR